MEYKDDLEVAQRRMAAWWEGAIIDRAVVQVTAPRSGVAAGHLDGLRSTDGLSQDRLLAWYTDPELVTPRHERLVAGTFWGGEAVPVMFPFSISLVAIVAASPMGPSSGQTRAGPSPSSTTGPPVRSWSSIHRTSGGCARGGCWTRRPSGRPAATTLVFPTSTAPAKSSRCSGAPNGWPST